MLPTACIPCLKPTPLTFHLRAFGLLFHSITEVFNLISGRHPAPLAALILISLALFEIASHPARAQDDTQEDPNVAKFMTGAYPSPRSKFCVLMDANTGRVLYSRNPHTHRAPASTTKMVACLVLLEHGKLTDTVTAPQAVVGIPESSLHLKPGERISLEDLLYAMMLRSANDTPVAGAYYLSGSIPPFVGLMNDKLREIGCNDSHFVTPNGLYDPGHYSSAYDLALVARYGFATQPMFQEIVKTEVHKIHRSIDIHDDIVSNTAMTFLKKFPGANGVKTGFVHQAGHCFVGSATRGGWRLIAVALNSSTCRSDVMQMLSYGFKNFQPDLVSRKTSVMGKLNIAGVGALAVRSASDLYDIKPVGQAFNPTDYVTHFTPLASRVPGDVKVGDKVGYVVVTDKGRKVMVADALATEPAKASFLLGGVSGTVMNAGTLVAKVFGGILALLVALFLGLACYGRTLTKNNRRRRSRLSQNI